MKRQLEMAYENLKKYETRAERNLKIYKELKPLYDNGSLSGQDVLKLNRAIKVYNKSQINIKQTKSLINFLNQGGMASFNSRVIQ